MMDNQGLDRNAMQQFVEGTPVYDINGDKVGTVSEHGVQDGCLVVHHGLLRDDLSIPLGVIAGNMADAVTLAVTKQDALDQNWSTSTTSATIAGASDRGTVTAQTDVEDVRMPIREEELVVGKRQDEIGRVRLHTEVVEEQQTITEPVTREQVSVERVAVQGAYTPGPDVFTEQDIDVPVMGEELTVDKRAVVKEEVRLRKDTVTEQQQVSDTVRKERVTVEGGDEGGETNIPTNLKRNQ